MPLPYMPNPYLPEVQCDSCGRSNHETFIAFMIREVVGMFGYEQTKLCGECFKTEWPNPWAKLPDPIEEDSPWIDRQLKQIGLGDEERKADIEMVSEILLDQIPSSVLTRMLSGYMPKTGFGLGGMADGGKSCAVASMVRAMITRNAMNNSQFKEVRPVKHVEWVCWPVLATTWRMNSFGEAVAARVDQLSKVRVLILDDLGRETRRSNHDDAAMGYLDAILTERDRNNLATLWTTNLALEELEERYGIPMIRRLNRINPLAWVSGLFPMSGQCRGEDI